MDDRRDAVIAADLLHERGVADVAHDERRTEQRVDPSELERVEHDDVPPGVAERSHRVRTDVAGAAGDEHGHRVASYRRDAEGALVRRPGVHHSASSWRADRAIAGSRKNCDRPCGRG